MNYEKKDKSELSKNVVDRFIEKFWTTVEEGRQVIPITIEMKNWLIEEINPLFPEKNRVETEGKVYEVNNEALIDGKWYVDKRGSVNGLYFIQYVSLEVGFYFGYGWGEDGIWINKNSPLFVVNAPILLTEAKSEQIHSFFLNEYHKRYKVGDQVSPFQLRTPFVRIEDHKIKSHSYVREGSIKNHFSIGFENTKGPYSFKRLVVFENGEWMKNLTRDKIKKTQSGEEIEAGKWYTTWGGYLLYVDNIRSGDYLGYGWSPERKWISSNDTLHPINVGNFLNGQVFLANIDEVAVMFFKEAKSRFKENSYFIEPDGSINDISVSFQKFNSVGMEYDKGNNKLILSCGALGMNFKEDRLRDLVLYKDGKWATVPEYVPFEVGDEKRIIGKTIKPKDKNSRLLIVRVSAINNDHRLYTNSFTDGEDMDVREGFKYWEFKDGKPFGKRQIL